MANPTSPQPDYYPPARSYAESSSLAAISLIASILGFFVLPVVGPIIGIITGHMAKSEIRKSNGQLTGEGLATAGLVLGYLEIILIILAACGTIISMAFFGVTFSSLCCFSSLFFTDSNYDN